MKSNVKEWEVLRKVIQDDFATLDNNGWPLEQRLAAFERLANRSKALNEIQRERMARWAEQFGRELEKLGPQKVGGVILYSEKGRLRRSMVGAGTGKVPG